MRVLRVIALACALVMAAGVQPSWAKKEKEKAFTCRPEVYERLTKAQDAIKENRFQDALGHVDRILKRIRVNDHEKALTLQTKGYVYAGMEKLQESAKTLEETLALDALPDGTQTNIRYSLGQIYLALKKPKEASKKFDDWIAHVEKPSASALYTVAAAKYQAEQYLAAVEFAEFAVKAVSNPKDSWLQLLMSGYLETKQRRKAIAVLQRLIDRHPEKRTQWLQLSALYSELGDEKRALAALELAYKAGLIVKKDELIGLAQRYLHQEVPFKAAEVLEKGLADGKLKKDAEFMRLLATAHFQSRDHAKATPVLEEAAEVAKDGELYLRLAQVYLDKENFDQVVRTGNKAIKKAGLRQPGQAHLLVGIAHYRMGNGAKAKKAFTQAARFPETKKAASGWLEYVASFDGGAVEKGN